MFIDAVRIYIKAGNGGNGAISFRREANVDKGGPDGGDGGKGGSVIFETDRSLNTLIDYQFKSLHKAEDGVSGRNKKLHGRTGHDLILKVPMGTMIYDAEGELLADLVFEGQRYVAAKGGRGGRGNCRFQSQSNKVPRIAENGEPKTEIEVKLELKLLSDVGLVGKPSVGKSSLLAAVSNARPKVAAYHFTTLKPKLGVVKVAEGKSFVISDLPGLIEGAALGHGLGHQFLKHIERTKVIFHVLDIEPDDGNDPYDNYLQIRKELEMFSPDLIHKPEIIVINKMDKFGAEEKFEELKAKFGDTEIFPISLIQKVNITNVLYKAYNVLEEENKKVEVKEFVEDFRLYEFKPEVYYEVHNYGNGYWEITGERIQREFLMTRIDTLEGLKSFSLKMKKIGLEDELIKAGVEEGDIICICDFEFEFSK